MVTAYILIQTEVGKASHVTDQVRTIEGVMQVDPVTGPYDIVARAEAADLDLLGRDGADGQRGVGVSDHRPDGRGQLERRDLRADQETHRRHRLLHRREVELRTGVGAQ